MAVNQDEFDFNLFNVEDDGVHVPSNTTFEQSATFLGPVFGLNLHSNAVYANLVSANSFVGGNATFVSVVANTAAVNAITGNNATFVSVISNTVAANALTGNSANITIINSNYVASNTFNGNSATFVSVSSNTYLATGQFVSVVPNGIPPLFISSNTKVDNLNVDLLDGYDSAYLLNANNLTGTISSSRLPGFGGDVTAPAGSNTLTLTAVNPSPGSFGNTTAVPVLTINGKGLVTTVTTATLGTAAVANTGSSGHVVPFLDGTNTWSGTNSFPNGLEASRLGKFAIPVEYGLNGTPTNGYLITTTIPFIQNQMPTIRIRGYDYGNQTLIDFSIVYYIYPIDETGTFYAYEVINHAAYDNFTVSLARDASGYVVIHLGMTSYYGRFYVELYEYNFITNAQRAGWVVTDAVCPTDKKVTVTKKRTVIADTSGNAQISGNLGLGRSPTYKLDAAGSARVSGYLIGTDAPASNIRYLLTNDSGPSYMLSALGVGTSIVDAALRVESIAGSSLRIGYSGDNSNYYDAPNHYFRSISGGTGYLTLSASLADFYTQGQFRSVLRIKDNVGNTSVMTSYISFQDATNTERGWIGYGSSNTMLRINNSLGSVDVRSSGSFLTVGPSDLLTSSMIRVVGAGESLRVASTNPFITFYNSSESGRLGYIQAITADGSITMVSDSGDLILSPTVGSVVTTRPINQTASTFKTKEGFKAYDGSDSGASASDPYKWGYQQAGAWSSPYPDLIIGYHTGLKIGAFSAFGGTRFYNSHPDYAPTSPAEIFSVGNGDNHVRVNNNLYSNNIIVSNTLDTPNVSANLISANTVHAHDKGLSLGRVAGNGSAISFYAPSYSSWQMYVSNAASSQGFNENITTVGGPLVNSWAIRSNVQSDSGYGWIWESTSATTEAHTPTIMAELSSTNGDFRTKGVYRRFVANEGYFVGAYDYDGLGNTGTGPIYTIGDGYRPGTTTLSNMYGIGYTENDASFLSTYTSQTTESGWGLYIASDGNARAFINGSTGGIWHTGNLNTRGSSYTVGNSTVLGNLAVAGNQGIDGNITFGLGRKGVVSVYNPSQTQAIWAMGSSYVLDQSGNSSTYGNHYGLAWSFDPDYDGVGNNPQSKPGLYHQLLLQHAGVTQTAIGRGIWTAGGISANGSISTNGSVTAGGNLNVTGGATIGSASTIGGYTILHSGNSTGYNAQGITYVDNRAVTPLPTDNGYSLTAAFKNVSSVDNPPVTAGLFAHILTMNGWAGGDLHGGGPTTQVSTGNGMAYRQSSNTTAWGAWYQFIDSKNNSSLQGDTRNTRGVTRLYRRDDNSDYSLQTHWTGTHWYLRGYAADTFHANVLVDNANYADTTVWSGITGRPTSWSTLGSTLTDSQTVSAINTRIGSGFYQSLNETMANGWPITTPGTWQHLISCTHSGTGNYYSMQIAGGFDDQNFYGRKTTNDGNQAWSKFWTTSNMPAANTNSGGNTTSTLVLRDGSGYTNQYYINYTPTNSENPSVGQVIVTTGGDGYMRKASIDHLAQAVANQNVVTGGSWQMSSPNMTTATVGGSWFQVFNQGGASYGAVMTFHRSGQYAVNMGLDNDNVFRIGGYSASANRLQLDMSGNLTMAGTVTASSDIRLKKNIRRLNHALQMVRDINGVYFDWKENDKTSIGFVADDIMSVVPELVMVDNSGYLSVAYGNMTALAVEAIKEVDVEVEALKEENEALKKRIALIEERLGL